MQIHSGHISTSRILDLGESLKEPETLRGAWDTETGT